MEPRDRSHALRRFAEYYSQASFPVPLIAKREFGIGNLKKIDARHLSFMDEADFRAYLVKNTPMFVSHSISYYDFPGATPIEKKVRQGADLVFDLDMHAEGKYAVYGLLGRVREDAERLISDFLVGDFGIRKDHITVAFSGNRGYHIHVRDTDYLSLGGDERKEIVDYVMGNGLDFRGFFSLEEARPRVLRIASGPTPSESGYRGRFARAVAERLETAPEELVRSNSREQTQKKAAVFAAGIREGNWNKQPYKPEELFARLAPLAGQLSLRSVNTDAGVTQDLSKLIRVENSIHGETGFIAKVASVDGLAKFDPLRDAAIPLKGALKIRFIEDVPQLALLGETTGPFKKDEMKEMAEAAALLYVLKGSATIIW